ncbi:unnamed protein product [Phytophthora fragariaefolia]|uniref:Unnamed protein product n=1 Tax=Phytophthora fragariaefolia TaxID=1490495 RepID=A0A9W7D1T0_9STRA|nr:unnamed protein product [Phytophthora fragariaefolia]
MYPSFTSKQDRESKHQALLARIARDQRLEAMKREAYANAIWATDSEQNKLKDATETGDTLSRIMAAMKSNSHSATAVGDIYEKMASSNAHLMAVEDKDAQPSSVFSSVNEAYEATGDFPMLEEKPKEEVSMIKCEKPEPVDRSNLTRDDIISTFKRNPYLSNYTFRPVIVKDGKIQEHSYTLDQTTGRILKPNGDRVNANNAIMRQVDWDLTHKAIWNKISSTKQRGLVIDDIRNKQRLKALFLRWQATTNSLDPMHAHARSLEADDDSESKAIDDYKMEDMTQDETLQFYSWLKSRGYDPEELNDDSKKRALDDSTISLDTRVNKKGINLTMGNKDKVQYVYDNIDGLDELKLRPYVRRNGNVTQYIKAYLAPGMRIFNNSGLEMKKQIQASKQIDWSWTFNYVISEVGNGAPALNHQIGRETSAEKQNLYAIRLKTIYDVLRVVDPIKAQEQEDLSKLPLCSFETPDQRDKNSSNRISPAKKDFVFDPPAGKGLTGRGLRGGGVAPRRKAKTYNLADIEGSGSASDLKYKRIGTKFIRKADLNNNRLKLVFPNRTSVGPIRSMSDELTAMVKDLLYNDNICQ